MIAKAISSTDVLSGIFQIDNIDDLIRVREALKVRSTQLKSLISHTTFTAGTKVTFHARHQHWVGTVIRPMKKNVKVEARRLGSPDSFPTTWTIDPTLLTVVEDD